MSTDTLTPTAAAVAFFFEHAGYSYLPGAETREQGRARCAQELAQAELRATDSGCSFAWSPDLATSSADFAPGEDNPYGLWVCTAYTADGKVFASLGGVDFGDGGEPWGAPYRRAVEAELACELEC